MRGSYTLHVACSSSIIYSDALSIHDVLAQDDNLVIYNGWGTADCDKIPPAARHRPHNARKWKQGPRLLGLPLSQLEWHRGIPLRGPWLFADSELSRALAGGIGLSRSTSPAFSLGDAQRHGLLRAWTKSMRIGSFE